MLPEDPKREPHGKPSGAGRTDGLSLRYYGGGVAQKGTMATVACGSDEKSPHVDDDPAAVSAHAPEDRPQKVVPQQIPLHEDIARMRKRLNSHYHLINPNTKYYQRWELTTLIALVYVAIVTPVEVAFTSSISYKSPFFALNQLINVIFWVDLVLNFFVMSVSRDLSYSLLTRTAWSREELRVVGRSHCAPCARCLSRRYRDESKGFAMIKNHHLIVKRNLRTWFVPDFFSCIDPTFIPGGDNFKAVRLVRLVRLFKLFKMLKASRMLARYETNVSMSYAHRDILKMSIYTFIVSHWMACVMGITDSLARDDPTDTETVTWMTAAGKEVSIASVHHRYLVALYFAVYTLTSIGFGDITAQTVPEFYVILVLMVLSSVFWAYVIGNFCNIMATSDLFGIEFKQRMDELNFMMAERRFEPELRQRCRMYYLESKNVKRVLNYRKIENDMSDAMKGEVAVANNQAWLDKVWYLKDAPRQFVVEISQLLNPLTYAPVRPFAVSARTKLVPSRSLPLTRARRAD